MTEKPAAQGLMRRSPGSVLGSLVRQASEARYVSVLRESLLVRSLVTGCGALVAGVLSAYSSPLNLSRRSVLLTPAAEFVGGLLVGLLGGFVILPALLANDVRSGSNETAVRKTLLNLITSLLTAIVCFLLGAILFRRDSG